MLYCWELFLQMVFFLQRSWYFKNHLAQSLVSLEIWDVWVLGRNSAAVSFSLDVWLIALNSCQLPWEVLRLGNSWENALPLPVSGTCKHFKNHFFSTWEPNQLDISISLFRYGFESSVLDTIKVMSSWEVLSCPACSEPSASFLWQIQAGHTSQHSFNLKVRLKSLDSPGVPTP